MKKSWIGIVIVAAFSASLGGCMMGPDYRRPDMPTPQSYRFMPDQASQQALDSRWWEDFGDPVLNGMVEEAIANNRDLKAALANSEKAAAAIMQTRAGLFPQINATAQVGRERLSEMDAEPVIGVPNPQNAKSGQSGRQLGNRSVGKNPADDRSRGSRRQSNGTDTPGSPSFHRFQCRHPIRQFAGTGRTVEDRAEHIGQLQGIPPYHRFAIQIRGHVANDCRTGRVPV